jgi:hypothetical protein
LVLLRWPAQLQFRYHLPRHRKQAIRQR